MCKKGECAIVKQVGFITCSRQGDRTSTGFMKHLSKRELERMDYWIGALEQML